MRQTVIVGLIALLLAGCSGGGGTGAATATGVGVVTSAAGAQATATEAAQSVASPQTEAAVPTATVAASATATAEPAPATPTATTVPSVLGGEQMLRTYRAMISMQINARLAAETAHQAAIDRLDPDERPVAALAVAGLLQSVDEAVPGLTPPAELDAAWQQALAAHEQVRDVTGRWLVQLINSTQAGAEFAPLEAQLEEAMLAADQAMADEYGVRADLLTEYRHRIVAATERVYD